MTEAEIQAGVLQGLAARKLFAWRQNTGKAKIGDRLVTFGLPGQADITGILPGGRRLEIECKSPLGSQSMAQIRFMQAVIANGGIYIVARDVAICLATIDQLLNKQGDAAE